MDLPTDTQLEELIALRHTLHRHPETANGEQETAQRIKQFLNNYPPDDIIDNLGGTGIAAIYTGKSEGKTLMFRCELDGLPITENNPIEYTSENIGKGHLCGHDGHMTIISGLAQWLSNNRPQKGRVVLLYQPAEETGQGAAQILADEKFKAIAPDYIFALHNIPGEPKGAVLIKDNIFASASKGIIVKLKGSPSHAAHPEGGRNPSLAAAQIIQSFLAIPRQYVPFQHAALITPIHIRVGQPAFGTSPGDGEVMATLRSHRNEDMDTLREKTTEVAQTIALAHQLKATVEWTEEFDAVQNHGASAQLVREAAKEQGLEVKEMQYPFSWSEDFGLFTSAYRGAMFGLGAGENQPQLHNEDYDFPDGLIPQGMAVFKSIINNLLNS